MSIPPGHRPRTTRRPSRIKIAVIWFALLLGSFLFGMLIISPLLGAILASREKETPPEPATPKRRSSVVDPMRTSQTTPAVTATQEALPESLSEPAIRLFPGESDSIVEAADNADPPLEGIHPRPGEAVEESPAPVMSPNPAVTDPNLQTPLPQQQPGGIQQGETID